MKRSQSLTNYVLLLSLVLTAFLGMEVYLKRAIQARVKDLTDALIAPQEEHIDKINETKPLLDEALGLATTSESHLEESLEETLTAITRVKRIPEGESFSLYSQTHYRTDDPEEEVTPPQRGAEARHALSNVVFKGVTSPAP